MKPLYLEMLGEVIQEDIDFLSENDVKDFEDGKPLHLIWDREDEVIRVIIFMDKKQRGL